jgi:plastocyanin
MKDSPSALRALLSGASILVAIAGCGGGLETGPEPNMAAALKIRDGFNAAPSKSGKAAAESGGGASQLKRLDGWATLKGRFVLDGSVPNPAPLTIDKDQAVCGVHPLFNESLVIGKGNGIANVVIYVRTPKIPVNKEYEKSAADSVTLDNKGCRFEPHVQKIRIGQTLSVKNSDPVAHNTNVGGKNLQGNPLIPAGATAEFKVEGPESTPAPVSCNIHPWMRARVVVTSNPYCAVSGDDGTFEIADLPAGELEFQIWQENGGALDVKNSDLQPTGGAGRFKVSLEPGKEKDLKDITVTTAALEAG